MITAHDMIFLSSIVLFLVSSRLNVCFGVGVTQAIFEQTVSLGDNVCALSRRVFEAKAGSLVSCVTMATKKKDCLDLSYRHADNTCYGCDTFVDRKGQFEPLSGAVFYQRLGVIPDGYIRISRYILKFVDSPALTYDAASGACSKSGGHLVKIDTQEMNTAIQSFLVKPENGYTNSNFWIQLREVAGVWQFADDSTPADLGSYWVPGEPNDPNHYCGHLWADDGFKWADYDCSILIGYICELAKSEWSIFSNPIVHHHPIFPQA